MSDDGKEFVERIHPSMGVTLSLLALDLAMTFALWVALSELAALLFLILLLAFSMLWWQSATLKTSLDSQFLYVNEARIERRFLGDAVPLVKEEWGKRRGIDFDPRAFHAHKFWMRSGVEVLLKDPRDPHPKWLIGSKRANELAALLNSSKDRS